jgi:glycolate oxidase FAD binding subunit
MRMALASIADPLRRIVGDAIRTGRGAERFAVAGMIPSVVVAPEHAEQVAELLALCSAEGWSVEPAGAGTWLDAGRRPERVDLVLTTERMKQVAEYEPADLTMGVGAGLSLDALRQEVGRYRQWLALDPPGATAGTVGATFATASAGPLRLGLGTARDLALGLEVVTGDGRILHFGGRVVKNVAGYDIVRLLVGSRGTLGVITRLHVRLHPIPSDDATMVAFADDAATLAAMVSTLRNAVQPVALEILSPTASARLLGETRWTLVVRVQGNSGTVRDASERLSSTLQSHGRALVGSEATTFWAVLGELEAKTTLSIRIADLPARLADTLAAASEVAHASGAEGEWYLAAHAGNGIVRLWRPEALPNFAAASVVDAIVQLRRQLATVGGTVLVPQGAAALGVAPFGDPGPMLRLMQGLKRAFDPAGVLAPGRFIA